MTARDYEMAGILLRLEMLANGATQAWNASGGGQGKPDDKVVAIVAREETPLHIHYRERYEKAFSDKSKDAVIAEAERTADEWVRRSEHARRVAAKATKSTEDLIIEDHVGQSAEVVAFQFNMHPDAIRRIRKRRGVSTETGAGLLGPAPVEDKPAAARELSRHGVSTRDIASRLGVSQSAVMKWIRKAAA